MVRDLEQCFLDGVGYRRHNGRNNGACQIFGVDVIKLQNSLEADGVFQNGFVGIRGHSLGKKNLVILDTAMTMFVFPISIAKIIGLLYLYSNAFLFCGAGISLALERAAPMAPVRIVEEIISHTALIPTKVQMKTITFFPPISP